MAPMSAQREKNPHSRLSETVYEQIKQGLFDFRFLPGDRLTETELAEKLKVSRTPIRQALSRLEQEGYLKLAFRNGWTISPFDFERFEQLYDLRIILELAAIQLLCEAEKPADLSALAEIWLAPPEARPSDPRVISENDEAFHVGLVTHAGNREMARVHRDITEKIRIIRRLDFTKGERIEATYNEHAQLLRLLIQRKSTPAALLMKSHIQASKAEVRKITMHMLHTAGHSNPGQ